MRGPCSGRLRVVAVLAVVRRRRLQVVVVVVRLQVVVVVRRLREVSAPAAFERVRGEVDLMIEPRGTAFSADLCSPPI